MTASVEQIKKEIRSLPPEEVDLLLRDLQREYVMPSPDTEDAEVEAAWEAEIGARMKQVMDGTVELISAEDSDRRTEALFKRLGVERPVFRP